MQEGVLEFSFVDLAPFWFGFFNFHTKNCSFSVFMSCADCGFSPVLSLVFYICQQ